MVSEKQIFLTQIAIKFAYILAKDLKNENYRVTRSYVRNNRFLSVIFVK